MNDTMNRKEKIMGFLYVFIFFTFATVICCSLIYYYNADYSFSSQKTFAVSKMEKMKSYQEMQNRMLVVTDSLHKRIKKYNPSVNATYEENEIKLMINDLSDVYNKNSWDKRYKSFSHVSDFYNMWFLDKKELWSKRENTKKFQEGIEQCRMTLGRRR